MPKGKPVPTKSPISRLSVMHTWINKLPKNICESIHCLLGQPLRAGPCSRLEHGMTEPFLFAAGTPAKPQTTAPSASGQASGWDCSFRQLGDVTGRLLGSPRPPGTGSAPRFQAALVAARKEQSTRQRETCSTGKKRCAAGVKTKPPNPHFGSLRLRSSPSGGCTSRTLTCVTIRLKPMPCVA